IVANWDVALGYSFFQVSAIDDEGLRSSSEIGKIATPRHQLQLRSFIQLPRQLELDSWAYYVGRIGSDVPSYLRLDAQLSWRPARRWELSISGQNLLQARHSEFVGNFFESELATPVQRTVNGKITWRF
ncbi:MAG: hypothetical protein ACXW3E_08100, partial [Thermoanaerobaculia bacterium]